MKHRKYCRFSRSGTFDMCDCLERRIAELEKALQEIALWDVKWPEKDPNYGPRSLVIARTAVKAKQTEDK